MSPRERLAIAGATRGGKEMLQERKDPLASQLAALHERRAQLFGVALEHDIGSPTTTVGMPAWRA
jgi:hypothetical protein